MRVYSYQTTGTVYGVEANVNTLRVNIRYTDEDGGEGSTMKTRYMAHSEFIRIASERGVKLLGEHLGSHQDNEPNQALAPQLSRQHWKTLHVNLPCTKRGLRCSVSLETIMPMILVEASRVDTPLIQELLHQWLHCVATVCQTPGVFVVDDLIQTSTHFRVQMDTLYKLYAHPDKSILVLADYDTEIVWETLPPSGTILPRMLDEIVPLGEMDPYYPEYDDFDAETT